MSTAIVEMSEQCKADVIYLRSRHRHTQELEDQLIALHQAGTPPNVMEYGTSKETGEALVSEALKLLKEKYSKPKRK